MKWVLMPALLLIVGQANAAMLSDSEGPGIAKCAALIIDVRFWRTTVVRTRPAT